MIWWICETKATKIYNKVLTKMKMTSPCDIV